MKNKNAGYSLVELIVVMAIMAVLLGAGIYGVSQTSGYAARKCANAISSSISSCKVTTLGKAKSTGDIRWVIYQENNKYYFKTVYNANTGSEYAVTEEVGKGVGAVTYGTGTAYSESDSVVADAPLELFFNRASGALCRYDDKGDVAVTDIHNITVKSRGKKMYTIEIYPATGKIKGTL